MDEIEINKKPKQWSRKEIAAEAKLFEKAKDLSIVGLKNCLDTRRSRKSRLLWIVLVTIGFLCAIYFIVERLIHYYSYPVATELDFIAAKSLPYPKITLCNANYIKKSGAEALGRQFLIGFI